jgi:acetyl-CoA/propionyl-CoA carboxylase biotin carboxyl carrier protein
LSAEVGQAVTAGQTLVVVEAMKMEHPLVAPFDGTVSAVHVTAGTQVGMEDPLVEVAPAEVEAEPVEVEVAPVDSAGAET